MTNKPTVPPTLQVGHINLKVQVQACSEDWSYVHSGKMPTHCLPIRPSLTRETTNASTSLSTCETIDTYIHHSSALRYQTLQK